MCQLFRLQVDSNDNNMICLVDDLGLATMFICYIWMNLNVHKAYEIGISLECEAHQWKDYV